VDNKTDKNSGRSGYTLEQLAELLGLTFEGNPETQISGIATLNSATQTDLSFYHNQRYFSDLEKTSAGAVIVSPDLAADCPVNVLLSENPYLAYARASMLFARGNSLPATVHPSAIIDPSVELGQDVAIGPNVVIGADCEIGDRVSIGPNTSIAQHCSIGADSQLQSNVVFYADVSVGERAIIHSGVVIGGDGFGFARDGEKQVKIAQLGGVQIGNDVEIVAGTTIDRGALEDTCIDDGVKIDNQVQIAHNVKVGANSVICGCSAIAGSSTLGKNCIIAGAVGIINHVTIADGVTVTAMSLVNRSIREKGVYSSGTGLVETATWKKNIVHFRQLDSLNSRVRYLEKQNRDN